MHITDPIADMLTRIRNANTAKHETVEVPASNMKKAIASILLEEGYIVLSLIIARMSAMMQLELLVLLSSRQRTNQRSGQRRLLTLSIC